MKYQVLFSLKNNEKVLMNVVCCSSDRHFKGKGEYLIHFLGMQSVFFFFFF